MGEEWGEEGREGEVEGEEWREEEGWVLGVLVGGVMIMKRLVYRVLKARCSLRTERRPCVWVGRIAIDGQSGI